MATARSVARFGGAAITVPMTAPTQQPGATNGQARDRTGGFGLSLSPATAEITGAVSTGRISLAVLLTLSLGLIAFYYGTRSIQGGG